MAKETQIIITVPGDLNVLLADYMFKLQDIGVTLSKRDAIIKLARIGINNELYQMRSSEGSGDGQ